MARMAKARVASFFNDRGAIAAIDYLFVALLAYAVRSVALGYGDAAAPIIRRALGLD